MAVTLPFAVDYSSDRIHIPLPGQICYFISLPEGDGKLSLRLVRHVDESKPVKSSESDVYIVTLKLQELDEYDASISKDEGVERPLIEFLIKYTNTGQVMWRPRFVRAIKVEAKPEPTNTDIMSVVALSQARFHDIEQRLAQLTTQIDRLIAAKLI